MTNVVLMNIMYKKEKQQDELSVITRAKELSMYILTVTDKSPKRFRFTITDRLQNYSLDVIENLYMANTHAIAGENAIRNSERRRIYQERAMAKLRLLSYMSMVARESTCILPKQYSQIVERVFETQKLLYAWVKSDEERVRKLREAENK